MTKKEIQQELEQKGIDFDSSLKKDELYDLLIESNKKKYFVKNEYKGKMISDRNGAHYLDSASQSELKMLHKNHPEKIGYGK